MVLASNTVANVFDYPSIVNIVGIKKLYWIDYLLVVRLNSDEGVVGIRVLDGLVVRLWRPR